MADNPYVVVGAPSYQAPQMDFSKFMQQPQQKQQGQQSGGQTFMNGLKQFLNSPNGPLASGSAVPGAQGPTSVGGDTGPAPLMQSAGMPMMNQQGLGLY
jgi:hypothetical protein